MQLRALLTSGLIAAGSLCGAALAAPSVSAETIVQEWGKVKPPPVPELKAVEVDPKTTAFLVLDLVKQTCNMKRRPRCVDSIPAVAKFLGEARAHKVPVIFSLIHGSTTADLMSGLVPQKDEPVVTSGADKFIGTDLGKILKGKGIKTVIVVGTAAQGAVLYTASAATLRGYKAIVPVDGMSAESLYFEQATAYILEKAPGVGANTTLTSFDKISF